MGWISNISALDEFDKGDAPPVSNQSTGENKIYFLSNSSLNNSGKLLRLCSALFHIHGAAQVRLGSSAREWGEILFLFFFCSLPEINWLGAWLGYLSRSRTFLVTLSCWHVAYFYLFPLLYHSLLLWLPSSYLSITLAAVTTFNAIISCWCLPPLTTPNYFTYTVYPRSLFAVR